MEGVALISRGDLENKVVPLLLRKGPSLFVNPLRPRKPIRFRPYGISLKDKFVCPSIIGPTRPWEVFRFEIFVYTIKRWVNQPAKGKHD